MLFGTTFEHGTGPQGWQMTCRVRQNPGLHYSLEQRPSGPRQGMKPRPAMRPILKRLSAPRA